MKRGLIAITVLSLGLNVFMGYVIYRNSHITIHNGEGGDVRRAPLDYESFRGEWGKAWLGLQVGDVTPEIAGRLMLDRAEGALVRSVRPGSPADKADMNAGDVILSFNGRKVRSGEQLRSDVAGSEIGREVYMCVALPDGRITVYAVPEGRPADVPGVSKSFPFLGVCVSEVAFRSDEAKQLEELGKSGGVWVEKVMEKSPAEKGGLEEGDIIMSFNSRKTRSLRELFSDLAGSEPGDRVRMCITRNGYRKTIYVTLMSAERAPGPGSPLSI